MGNPHNDPIVVTACVADFDVRRVLLDSGSATDILFESTFLQMGFKEANLLHAGTTLLGFSGERVQLLGFISLLVSFCYDNGHAISMVNFTVIRARSGYNAILGGTTLFRDGYLCAPSLREVPYLQRCCHHQRRPPAGHLMFQIAT
ncbi:hypothetical protein AXF42_Ash000805 [Apostasia shenzhenica]|uniref:Peptidase A2 domain-containing protein n=1 Tax=Apostasia shenzhenica TaxID=1088818 RepID=A0A2I0AT32_9ASPA|nr:hypothetical protein AXF42_Ash000805 [Apostasia shenzhenica]